MNTPQKPQQQLQQRTKQYSANNKIYSTDLQNYYNEDNDIINEYDIYDQQKTQTSSPSNNNYSLKNISVNYLDDDTNNYSSHFLAQNDEIKEYENDEIKYSSTILPNSNNNIGTFDSLSKVLDISQIQAKQCEGYYQENSCENIQQFQDPDNNENKEKIYLKSCNQIERQAAKRRQKDLTINVNFARIDFESPNQNRSSKSNSGSSTNSPKQCIEQRRKVKLEVLTPGRRKSLPEYNMKEKEPDMNYSDMYKIYVGDTIDENSKNNNENDIDEDALNQLENLLEMDQIDEIEDIGQSSQKGEKKHSTINPIKYLKKQKSFAAEKSGNTNEIEENVDTPLLKGSKFDEDRYYVFRSKEQNGGITPLKYCKEQKQNFARSSVQHLEEYDIYLNELQQWQQYNEICIMRQTSSEQQQVDQLQENKENEYKESQNNDVKQESENSSSNDSQEQDNKQNIDGKQYENINYDFMQSDNIQELEE